MICVSYSRISLRDIAAKLQLDSAEDAEYIVAKAIRDVVIDAEINHTEGFVQSKVPLKLYEVLLLTFTSQELIDVYGTNEPQDAYHQRITFCLKVHNDAIKAMRYPPNAYRKYLETPEVSQAVTAWHLCLMSLYQQRRERERQDEELAEEIENDDDDLDF